MNPFKKNENTKAPKGHDRFTIIQEKIVKFLQKQPDKQATNSDIAKHVNKRTGHISSTLKVLEKKNFIEMPERNLSIFTGKKIKTTN